MRGSAGFTLVELVAVLIIIGALAVFAAPRLNTTGFAQYGLHQELLAAIRHAQKTANASGCEVDVNVDAAADSYTIRYNGVGWDGCNAIALAKPGGSGDLTGEAPQGVDITGGAAFTLNAFGIPGAEARVTLASGRQVIVEANTGYVHD